MDLGLEIKILRERAKMSSKDLAEKIGLSQSQMSRLEKGQRRIDAEILHKISTILKVSPAYFFDRANSSPQISTTKREAELSAHKVNLNIGKLIRSERRKFHLTAEEFGKKIGKSKPYVHAIEEGEIDVLHVHVIQKICKALKKSPADFFLVQQDTILSLKKQLEKVSKNPKKFPFQTSRETGSKNNISNKASFPIIGNVTEGYPKKFSKEGFPLGTIEGEFFFPGINDPNAFALYIIGNLMNQKASPSFLEGDLVVFSPLSEVLHGDYIFLRFLEDKSTFCQVFFDGGANIRLQPLNRDYPPTIILRSQILGWWKMIAHINRY